MIIGNPNVIRAVLKAAAEGMSWTGRLLGKFLKLFIMPAPVLTKPLGATLRLILTAARGNHKRLVGEIADEFKSMLKLLELTSKPAFKKAFTDRGLGSNADEVFEYFKSGTFAKLLDLEFTALLAKGSEFVLNFLYQTYLVIYFLDGEDAADNFLASVGALFKDEDDYDVVVPVSQKSLVKMAEGYCSIEKDSLQYCRAVVSRVLAHKGTPCTLR